MIQTEPTPFAHVRNIDNSRRNLSLITLLFLIFLIIVLVWFFNGGSFRFYASLFFGIYFLTKNTWLSIIFVSVVQTIIFLPFRIINENFKPDLKEFEKELDKTKGENQQILLTRQIKKGSWSVVFHTLNFILLALAFFSVGRIFFMDFYHHPIDANKFLYDFIPYPQYPLQNTVFKFPWVHITKTIALSWQTIFTIWGIILGFFITLRLVWVFLRRFLSKNKSILNIRIQYNQLLIFISSFIGTLFLLSLLVLRHIPTTGEIVILSADLTRQNTGFNIITAVCTFIATILSGIHNNRELVNEARLNNIPEKAIKKVTRQHLQKSAQNGLFLALFALWVTRLMPCSHDLSVLSFELIYFISPLTFDRLVKKTTKPTPVNHESAEEPLKIS